MGRGAAPVCWPSLLRAGSVIDRDWPSSAESSSTTTMRVWSAVRTVSAGGFSFDVSPSTTPTTDAASNAC